ncbi:MAG: lipoyl(octanoyl) transferase LipB [Gemmatimonadetes bacterium]|nr:lipoyl(octanoyl) transferase LipB [Gemmatimonadota bacterium]
MPYGEALALQERCVSERRAGAPDRLLLLEHPHVITSGSGGDPAHVLVGESELQARGIERYETGRGGDITYHGPGQLVGYPILDLKPDRRDLHAYLRALESVLIHALLTWGIEGVRQPPHTGVWVGDAKVAALGIRVSSGWITSHGFALNVSTDLSYFETIVPCGIADRRVTSLSELLGREIEIGDAEGAVGEAFRSEFGHGRVDRLDGLP